MAEKNPSLTYFINEGLKWAYKYYEKMLRPTVYLIAMCEFPPTHLSLSLAHIP